MPEFAPIPVSEYPRPGLENDPFLYPGARPLQSFLTDGETVYRLSDGADGDSTSLHTEAGSGTLDDYLRDRQLPTLGQRIPVLAYGSNLCPGVLAGKFGKGGPDRADLLTVPTLYAGLRGYDVVWSGGPARKGNFVAALYRGAETEATTVSVGINFLTPQQLLLMHSTELTYELSSLGMEVAGEHQVAYYYAGRDSVFLADGAPVAVADVNADGRALEALPAREMTERMLAFEGVGRYLRETFPTLGDDVLDADRYIDLIRSLRPQTKGHQPRLELKNAVGKILQEMGLTGAVDTADDGDPVTYSWANPSTLATYDQLRRGVRHSDVYRLPSMELPLDDWGGQKNARHAILKAVGTHFRRLSGLKEVDEVTV
jgi:hypothetical protein